MTDLANLKILCVIPEKYFMQAVREVLQSVGISDVSETRSSTKAWNLIRHTPVDVILSAWDMPEMSGMALLKLAKSEGDLSHIPFVLIANQVTKAQVIEAGEAGVSDIVLLPLTPHTLLAKLRRLMESEADLQKVEAQRRYDQGMALMEEGKFEEAIGYFESILEIYENAEVFYNMGYIKTAQGSYEEAIHYFRKATLINETYARAYKKMGECYSKLGRMKLAERAFQKAANIYMDKEQDESAEELLLELLKINPDTINVYNSLGILYRRQKRYDKAVDFYKKALKVNPEDENIYYNLGRIYFDLERFNESRLILEQALKINPAFAEAKDLLKLVHIRLKD